MKKDKSYLGPPFLAIAHRGGALHPANVGRENTLEAFQVAVDLGYRYLETDVHATKDGVVVVFHDDSLERVTDAAGRISSYSYADLKAVRVGGSHIIPTLGEALETFREARFNIDIKAENAAVPLAKLLKKSKALNRVLVTSFSSARLKAFRRNLGQQAIEGASTPVIAAQLALFRLGIQTSISTAQALQVPVKHFGLTVITKNFLAGAHAAGLKVHVWTINDSTEMNRLIDLGVDGIITDELDALKKVLIRRKLWA